MMTNDLVNLILNSSNPQQMAMNILKTSNNPIMRNVLSMMNSNNAQGIEQVARNMCREKGIDADALINQFKSYRR